ncbi:MAG: hypothetical protein ABSE62_00545 [Chthoniobacteraceae bacterium]
MPNPSQLVNVDLTGKTSDWTPPPITFGEDLTLVLRFTIDNNGSAISPNMTITGMKASVGNVDARPLGGGTCLVIGNGPASSANTTAPILFNDLPSTVAAKINALSGVVAAYGICKAFSVPGGYALFFGTRAAEVPISATNNLLWPVSFVRVSAWQNGAEWVHQVRFTQAPVAFTSDSLTVLPPAPAVTEVQAGGTTDGIAFNAIQAVYIPPNFLGSYVLTMGMNRSGLLSVADTPATMTVALSQLAAGIIFTVTNPLPNTAYITFGGTAAGAAQPLLGVTVVSAPPADPALTLQFDRAELAVLLQRESPATLPLEVWIETLDSSTGVAATFTAFVTEVTISLPLTYPDLEDTPTVDWLRPPSPINYVPFGNNNVLTGQQFYTTTIGDGGSINFDVTHGLDTEIVMPTIYDIAGNELVLGTDYRFKLNSENDVIITALGAPPAEGGWTVIIVSAQTVGAWASGLTVTIAQVTGLSAILAGMAATIATLQALIPTTPPQIAGGASGLTITIPNVTGYVPMQTLASNGQPKARALLPAQNTLASGIAAGTFPLGTVAAAGTVVQNQTGLSQLVPAAFGIDDTWVPPNGYVASDGRLWYVVNQAAGTNSFFAAAFERTLFSFEVNSAMMPAGSSLMLTFSLALQLLVNNTEDTAPSPVGLNLQNVVWATATPIVAQGIILDAVSINHTFGASVAVNPAGTSLTAQRNLYGVWTAGAPAPPTANFALRARLTQFDTEDAVVRPRGIVSYAVTNGSAVLTI